MRQRHPIVSTHHCSVPIVLLFVVLACTACVSRKVGAPRLLTPIQDATLAELIERVNETRQMSSLIARIDIQLESEVEAERGQSERYATAVGRLVLAREKKVYLQIQAPIVKTNFAEFASDGSRFQLLVYPEKYRVMLTGTNDKLYINSKPAAERDERLRMAGALANIRPQHFTETLLFDPVVKDKQGDALLEEFRQVEDAMLPGSTRRERVIRSYFVLSTIKYSPDRGWWLSARFWFDRNHGLSLVRRQIYVDEGRLVEEVNYSGFWREPRQGMLLPSEISFSRPYDQYSARLYLNQSSVVLNNEVPAAAFVLEKPADWSDDVQVVDLDHAAK